VSWGLDTTFLIRLLTDDPPEQAQVAKEELSRCLAAGERPKVTDLVVMEAYFALQTHYSVPKRETLDALQLVLESGDVDPIGFALDVLQRTRNLASAKPGFLDRVVHAQIQALGAKMITFEKAASKLPGVRVL
jgi:predicted nucleic acid-binding protein